MTVSDTLAAITQHARSRRRTAYDDAAELWKRSADLAPRSRPRGQHDAEAEEVGVLVPVEMWSTPLIGAGASVRLEMRLTLPAEIRDGLYSLRLLHSSYDRESQPLAWAVTALRIDEADVERGQGRRDP